MKRLGLLLLLLLLPAPAAAKTVLFGPAGKKTDAARHDLIALINAGDKLVADIEFAGGEAPPAEESDRRQWLIARAKETKTDLILFAAMDKKKLHISAYAGAGGEPDAKELPLDAKGKMTAPGKASFKKWLAFSLHRAHNLKVAPIAAAPPPERREERPAAALPGSRPPPNQPPPPPASSASATSDAPARSDDKPLSTRAPAETGSSRLGPTTAGVGLLSSGMGADVPPIAFVTLSFSPVARSFSYHDGITANLRPYQGTLPTPAILAELFPLAPTGSKGLGALGLVVRYGRSVGVESRRKDGLAHPTTSQDLALGLEYRLQLGSGPKSAALIPSLLYQDSSFVLAAASDGSKETELPNIDYTGARIGAALELPMFWILTLVADAAFIKVFSAGEIISRTYLTKGGADGAAGSLGVRLELSPALSIDLAFAVEHYFYAFDPTPGDAFVAGGALDDRFAFRGGFRLAL